MKAVQEATNLSPTRRAQDRPGLTINPTHMAWRPYENLICGELDNRIPGKVTGWMRFFRLGSEPLRVTFDLAGDFHEDIRGKVIRLTNPQPQDRNAELGRAGTYMEGFSPVQRGPVGDITAGLSLGLWTEELARKLMAQNELVWDELGIQGQKREERRQEFARLYRERIQAEEPYFPYAPYPYIEWYSDQNGRVVLELDASQVEVIEEEAAVRKEKTPEELREAERKRRQAMGNFMAGTATSSALWWVEVFTSGAIAPRRVGGQKFSI